ncbi:MAG: hypothetical protein AAFU79_34590, partial [Myxococcota bacterium]
MPDAPLYRRTEGDLYATELLAARRLSERWLEEKAVQPGLQQPSLVSSYSGSIDRILLSFPGYAVRDPQLVAAYRSLIDELRVGTQFIVIHHKSDGADVASWFDSAGHLAENVTLVALADYVNFTDWAEDAYVALADVFDDSSYLMEPWEFLRAGDALIAEAAQEHSDITAS